MHENVAADARRPRSERVSPMPRCALALGGDGHAGASPHAMQRGPSVSPPAAGGNGDRGPLLRGQAKLKDEGSGRVLDSFERPTKCGATLLSRTAYRWSAGRGGSHRFPRPKSGTRFRDQNQGPFPTISSPGSASRRRDAGLRRGLPMRSGGSATPPSKGASNEIGSFSLSLSLSSGLLGE